MKNAGIAGGLVAIGIGLATIGLSNFSRQADAVPAVAVTAGPEEPTIVWYGLMDQRCRAVVLIMGLWVTTSTGRGQMERWSVDTSANRAILLVSILTQLA